MGNVSEKENSSQDNGQQQALLMKMLLAVGIFIVVVIIPAMVIVILALKQPSTPREAILRHPDGEMVVAGITKQDLEQAMKASKEWARSYVREALRGASRGDFSEAREEALKGIYPMQELLATGRVIRLANGTKCSIIESRRSMCKVRITEGLQKGQTCWVYRRCVVR